MDTEASLQEYLKLNLRVPVLGRLGPLAKALDFVANAAPGVKEILTIGKICWEVRESIEGRADIDLVVVDAPRPGTSPRNSARPTRSASSSTSARCARRRSG